MTACTDPLYRSFARARDARTAPIHEWSAKSVGADPARIGLKGSWTQVYRLFSPSEDRPKRCEYVRNAAELIEKIAARYHAAAPGAQLDADESYALDGKEPTYHGEFWVFAEREGERCPLGFARAAGQGARGSPTSSARRSARCSPAMRPATGRRS